MVPCKICCINCMLVCALWINIVIIISVFGCTSGLSVLGRDVVLPLVNEPAVQAPEEVGAAAEMVDIEGPIHSSNEHERLPDHNVVAKKSVTPEDFPLDSDLESEGKDLKIKRHLSGKGKLEGKEGRRAAALSGRRRLSPESMMISSSELAMKGLEEKILDEIISARKDALRLRVRNSSELHIDNHNDSNEQSGKPIKPKSPSDPISAVLLLPKPFHFHIPILPVPKDSKTAAKSGAKKSSKPKRDELIEGTQDISSETDDASMFTGLLTKRETVLEDQAPASNSRRSFHALHNPTMPNHDSHEERKKVELDALLEQHPKLVPPINRKRNSGHGERQEGVDDESHHFLMIFGNDRDDDLEIPEDDQKVSAMKREVKKVNFSQDLVDSILGHEDDLSTYRDNIKSHAEKLGVQPHEVVHRVVFGNASRETKETQVETSPTEIKQRRHQFQQLFLGDDDTKRGLNEIVLGEKEKVGAGTVNGDKRYSSYMKILKRAKRGLKSWLKKIFKKDDKKKEEEDRKRKEEEAAEENEDTPKTPKRKPTNNDDGDDDDDEEKPSKKDQDEEEAGNSGTVYNQEADENGDTQVDLLLPTPLRRSSYLKRQQEVAAKRFKEEEEFEEEYEKSEEKEVKRRREDRNGIGSGSEEENDEGGLERKADFRNGNDEEENERDKRSAENNNEEEKEGNDDDDDDDEHADLVRITPIEENMESRGGFQTTTTGALENNVTLSKDEILLVHEMLLNIVNYRCPKITRPVLDNILSISQIVIGMSNLPNYILERRYNVERLFEQILSCSSNEEKSYKWTYPEAGEVRNNPDKPHKRTKRIRRGRSRRRRGGNTGDNNGNNNVPDNDNDSKYQGVGEQEKTEKSSAGVLLIPRLMKLNVLLYKLIIGICENTVDSNLFDESVLAVENELVRVKGSKEKRAEIETYVKRFDLQFAENVFFECYQEVQSS